MESFGNFEGVGIFGNFGNFQFRPIFNILWDFVYKNQPTEFICNSNALVLHYFFGSLLVCMGLYSIERTPTLYYEKKIRPNFLSFITLICYAFPHYHYFKDFNRKSRLKKKIISSFTVYLILTVLKKKYSIRFISIERWNFKSCLRFKWQRTINTCI